VQNKKSSWLLALGSWLLALGYDAIGNAMLQKTQNDFG
jgi:hypothetical protein